MPTRLLVFTVVLLLAGSPLAERLEIVAGEGGSRVSFFSKAPMESFEGKTGAVAGYVEVNLDDLTDSLFVRVEVDMASFDTGIGLRNQHMRENHLETDRFPLAVFSAGRLVESSGRALEADTPVTCALSGTMNLHGVERELDVPLELLLTTGADGLRRLQVKGEFDISLADYEIARPKFLVLKLNDVQKVTLELVARETP